MTNDTRSRLATTIAGYSQASRTCDRWDVSIRDSNKGGLLLRIVLICCCVTVTCGSKFSEWQRGENRAEIESVLKLPPQMGYCDFDINCDWEWNENQDFKKVNARTAANSSKSAPKTDAENSSKGHFLWFSGKGYPEIWSEPIPPTDPYCHIEFWLYMVEMEHGFINVTQMYSNNMSYSWSMRRGKNTAAWEKKSFSFRSIDQPYKLVLRVYLPHSNSCIGVDNIRLVKCIPESIEDFTQDMLRCNNGSCLYRTRVCDFTKDCADGEDEAFECDKIPKNARCNFEDGWCGWTNVPGTPLNWIRLKGPMSTERPSYDHTYHNETGMYAFVNLAPKDLAVIYQYLEQPNNSRANMTSPLYNPTPPYSSDPKSPYYRSCQVRSWFYSVVT